MISAGVQQCTDQSKKGKQLLHVITRKITILHVNKIIIINYGTACAREFLHDSCTPREDPAEPVVLHYNWL